MLRRDARFLTYFGAVTTDDLKHRLGQILAEEECGPDVNWVEVAYLSNLLAAELPDLAPPIVASYLHGAEQRQTDAVFGHAQRSELISYLQQG